ncbi:MULTISPECIES: hypothetical protein [Haloarcula]|uniref:Uncharacterized protein n=1 Tax=Haloarcula pellucida TaxID=1427151 RepID=A0A830GI13_9EURY|nr:MULTISPECIES: hypothetical protein [Halomicroarcula]MBX0346776.1 hypothetical protein [Halomicroarcula pellucida]MDS0277346.1 hypothetical protein [Halomicroarcula sp. S1AR25-4]QIO22252.1 hypothetical protein G9465_07820 [Haloarcula sp. JP-L23]GGN85466.1 hypothetical protein GCM10009030_01940 [Halomicroarcula pellucida]
MIHDLRDGTAPTCDASDCDRPLGEPALVFETAWGRREAYECACGAVTVTVARSESSR